MPLQTNLAGSAGMIKDVTYGTVQAVNRWFPVDSANAKFNPNRVQGQGLAAGRHVAPTVEFVETHRDASGAIVSNFWYNKMGLVLNMITCGVSTIAQQGGSAAWLQTHSHTATSIGQSATLQVGVTEYSTGTVKPFTALGAKVNSAQFTCGVGELLKLNVGFDAKDLTEGQALAAPSYTSMVPFHFGNLTVKIGASYGAEATVQGVTKVDVTMPRPYNTPIYAGATTEVEPETNDWVAITGSLSSDMFLKATLNDLWAANTPFSMVWEWVGPIIASTFKNTIRIKFPSCMLTGDTPELSGPDVASGDWPFEVKNDLTNAPVIIEYMSTDVAI